jgi:hypothetical protein
VTSSWLTTTYPAFLSQFRTKLLTSVDYLASNSRVWLICQVQPAGTGLYNHLFTSVLIHSSEGSRDAGFKTLWVFMVTSGDSKRMAWHLVSISPDIHKWLFNLGWL